MDTSELIALLAEIRAGRPEDEALDWKRAFWDLKRDEGRREFLKDIVAAANSIKSDGIRRIIIGVSSSGTIHNAILPLDEASIQQYLSAVTPIPSVRFEAHKIENEQLVVVEICPPFNRPYVAKVGSDHFVWVRQGSATGTASRYHFDEFYGRKRVSPDLYIQWINEEEEVLDVLEVPSLSDIDIKEESEKLLQLRPSNADLKFLREESSEVIKLIRQVGPEYLDLGKLRAKPEELIEKPFRLADRIDKLLDLACRSPDEFVWRRSLYERAICPSVKIFNGGTRPASSVIVYLDSSESVKFLSGEELQDMDLSVSQEMHSLAMKVISLARNRPKPSPAVLLANFGRSNFPYNVPAPYIPGQLKPVEFWVNGGRLRIDLNFQLKHNFGRIVTTEYSAFIVTHLRRGEEATIEYECHADEQEHPSKGVLVVRGS